MPESEQRDRVKELLKSVGMEGDLKKMPSDISGGMQKRVGLARALALDPDILLLDEPTAGLDPITSGEIDELILKLQKEHAMASIVVTHDMQSAKTIAGRLALLHEGNIVIEAPSKIWRRVTTSLSQTLCGGTLRRTYVESSAVWELSSLRPWRFWPWESSSSGTSNTSSPPRID